MFSLAAIGILAACITQTTHEVLGHSIACIVSGGKVTTLSAAFFRCDADNAIINASGPTANLVLGAIALAVLSLGRAKSTAMALFLLMLASFNLLLGAGSLIYSGLLNIDDWSAAARDIGAPANWRIGAVVSGALLYVFTVWGIASQATRIDRRMRTSAGFTRMIRAPYIAGTAAIFLACALNSATPLAAALQGLLEIGVSSLGLLRINRPNISTNVTAVLPITTLLRFSPLLVIASLAVLAVFALTLGRGVV
ncbi:MAG: hypothetical protein R3C60_02295 [Parvularculaceae bacterium]